MEKNKNISVTCLDENKEMLEICKDRLLDNGFFTVFLRCVMISKYLPSYKVFYIMEREFTRRDNEDAAWSRLGEIRA